MEGSWFSDRQSGSGEFSMPVRMTFRDSLNRYWRRDSDGGLTEVPKPDY
jgi:hypothetical protein